MFLGDQGLGSWGRVDNVDVDGGLVILGGIVIISFIMAGVVVFIGFIFGAFHGVDGVVVECLVDGGVVWVNKHEIRRLKVRWLPWISH